MKIAAFFTSLLFVSQAFANNNFIPNYYRSYRTQNHLSALGWSDRKEANLEYGFGKGKVDDGITDTDLDLMGYVGSVFYRFDEAANVEFTYGHVEVKPDGGDAEKTSNIDLGVGYQFNENIAIGASYLTNKLDDGTNDVTASGYALGLGYRMNGNTYLGIGYTTSKFDDAADTTISNVALGGGYVWGDAKKPTAALEAGVFSYGGDVGGNDIYVKGLWNHEAAQLFAGLTLVGSENTSDQKTTGTRFDLGVDYQWEHIYVAPRIILANTKNDDTDVKTEGTEFALEVGYRQHGTWEAFARYESEKEKIGDEETTGTPITIGASYFF